MPVYKYIITINEGLLNGATMTEYSEKEANGVVNYLKEVLKVNSTVEKVKLK